MKHYITNRDEYKHYVDIKTCQRPDDLVQIRFENKSIDENGKVFHSSNYELFLTEDQIKDLIKSLQNHD